MTATSDNLRASSGPDGKRPEESWRALLGIAADALRIMPPLYVSSIFGLPHTWIPPFHRYSEFRIVDLWRAARTLRLLRDTWIPSLPLTPPPGNPPALTELFWKPTVILQRGDHNGNYTTFPEETWFFVNGIMTNDSVAQVNSAYLAYLFHRPITMIQNSTDSLLIDLFECAFGKEWYRTIEPAIKAFPVIYAALCDKNKKRVVVICHSEGTIIMAVVLRLLAERTKAEVRRKRQTEAEELLPGEAEAMSLQAAEEGRHYALPEFVYPDDEPLKPEDFPLLDGDQIAKLEVYCFANCANTMEQIGEWQGVAVPHIESYGNDHDIVARLGMLARRPDHWGIQIDGHHYKRTGAWGHLLNEHYLIPIAKVQKQGRKQRGDGTADPFEPVDEMTPPPRLYDYINGGSPQAF